MVSPLPYHVENQVATASRTATQTFSYTAATPALNLAIHNPPSAIKEWYVNQATGLEQGFTFTQPVGERLAGEPLRLVLQVDGGWQMRTVEDGRAVELQRVQSGATLRYDKLVVQDATGRELQARMQTQGGELWLEVEETGAVYPVTIDPTFSQLRAIRWWSEHYSRTATRRV